MKAIVDLDSAIYASCFNVETLNEAKDKLNTIIGSILDDLNETCELDDVVLCSGSTNNFRKTVLSSYKANRTQDKPNFLNDLHKYAKEELDSKFTDGYETDDVVATLWKQSVEELGENSVIVVANDKDYKQLPCWYFDTYFKRRELYKISEVEALRNFYTQMIVGDSADNVNYCKGYGASYAKKLLKTAKKEYQFVFRVYRLFKELYGDDARNKFNECKNILKLRTNVKQIKSLSTF